MSHALLENPQYNPNALMDFAISALALKNDAQLSRALDTAPPVVSKIRHRKLPIGPAILLRLHDLTNQPARELRRIMGVESAEAGK